MNYSELISKLEESGYERQGSSTFKEYDKWIIGLIGLSGKFQQAGSKAFIICARPQEFEYMDAPKKKFALEPIEYPFKLTIIASRKDLKYKSQLLHFDHSRLDLDSDWSIIYDILVNDLPNTLTKIGISGLIHQLKELKDPGYIEKVWLGEGNA